MDRTDIFVHTQLLLNLFIDASAELGHPFDEISHYFSKNELAADHLVTLP